MKKVVPILLSILVVLGMAATANAMQVYENYEGFGQYVGEGHSYSFDFDLLFFNLESGTDSNLALANDVAIEEGQSLQNAFININLFALDRAPELVAIELIAYQEGVEQEYLHYSSWFNASLPHVTQNFHLDISDTLFMNDLYGTLKIEAKLAPYTWNNFFITEVGIGGDVGQAAPVPEPATLLLLGTGLLAASIGGRKRFIKKA